MYLGEGITSTAPYGREPAFNALKPQFAPNIVGREADYFNMTPGSGEVSDTGHPFAFFSRPVKGLPLGFPIYFDVCIAPPYLHFRTSHFNLINMLKPECMD